MKAMIDTNVALDALLARAPFNEAAEEILLAAAAEEVTVCATASAVMDIYYVIRKGMKDAATAKRALMDLLDLIEIADVTGGDCLKAFDVDIADYEDALFVVCAEKAKADYIVTRDEALCRCSRIPVLSPPDLVAKIRRPEPGKA
jgi:predicted nucleic acid-binding protein